MTLRYCSSFLSILPIRRDCLLINLSALGLEMGSDAEVLRFPGRPVRGSEPRKNTGSLPVFRSGCQVIDRMRARWVWEMSVDEFFASPQYPCHVLACKERSRGRQMTRTLRHGKYISADQMRENIVSPVASVTARHCEFDATMLQNKGNSRGSV